ncbi:MAG: hypothetical protein MRY32_02095 [Rickettsiales bacterium]|nr:hypothetical protein [Rickettsiales bacterium]
MFAIKTKPSLYRDFALLSVLIVFILFLVSIWVSYETYQEHSESVVQKLESEAVRIDRALIIEIERSSYVLESIARQVSNDGATIEQLERLFSSFKQSSYSTNSEYFWVDVDQNVILSSERGILEEPNPVSDRDYMKKVILTPWKVQIGQPIMGRSSRKWVMPLAIGLTNDRNKFIGAVVLSLDIGSFKRELRNVIKEEGINFAITNLALTKLTEQSRQSGFFNTYFDIEKLAKINFLSHPSGMYSRGSLFDDSQIFGYYELSSEYPYIIFVGYDPQVHTENVNSILLPRLLQILIITLFLISILWTVRRRIIQPVIALTGSTSRLIRGKGFETGTLDGPAEIEMLAEEIQRLADYISERKRIERELLGKNEELMHIKESAEATNLIKAEFFKEIGESLLQPVMRLKDLTQQVYDEKYGPIGDEKYLVIADYIHKNSQYTIDLLHDILSISRTESGLLTLKEAEVDVAFVLRKCVRILQERTRFENIEVLQHIEPDLPTLYADEERLKQLILNLLMGSAGQIKSGDTIRVYLEAPEDIFTIQIEYMIPEPDDNTSDLPDLESFAAEHDLLDGDLDETATTKGLGLALSKLIVSMHGAKLDIKAKGNRHVSITITFPKERLMKAEYPLPQ